MEHSDVYVVIVLSRLSESQSYDGIAVNSTACSGYTLSSSVFLSADTELCFCEVGRQHKISFSHQQWCWQRACGRETDGVIFQQFMTLSGFDGKPATVGQHKRAATWTGTHSESVVCRLSDNVIGSAADKIVGSTGWNYSISDSQFVIATGCTYISSDSGDSNCHTEYGGSSCVD